MIRKEFIDDIVNESSVISLYLIKLCLQLKGECVKIPQNWTKDSTEIHKIQKRIFFYRIFYSRFFAILNQKASKLGFLVASWVLPNKLKYFRNSAEVL